MSWFVRITHNHKRTTMTEPSSAGERLRVSAALAESNTIQQNSMKNASRTKRESETDVLMMDDVQFTASLDRLLDSELVHSAYNSGGTPRTVSTDPSVASSTSSIAAARAPQQAAAMLSSSFSVSGGSLPPPPPQRPTSSAPAPANTLLSPPPQNPVLTGPSTLTQRLAFTMPMTAAPANLRSSIPMTAMSSMKQAPALYNTSGRKRGRDPSLAVSENEGERERRRQDRNLREQQRSRRITEQISLLRDVMTEAGVPCKPDKNSILIGVYDYIVQLQSRKSLLDEEHKKLLDTIARTNEMVNHQYYQATADGSSVATGATPAPVSNDLLSDATMTNGPLEDENVVFVQGLDYKSVFKRCAIALAVASIDGRFIDCNAEFVNLSGYSRKELLPSEELSKTELRPEAVPLAATGPPEPPPRNLSLFNLLNREDMEKVFSAMSGMLRQPVLSRRQDAPVETASTQQDYWSGFVRQNRDDSTLVSNSLWL